MYTLKLDLTGYQLVVLVQLLHSDQQRSRDKGTTGSHWNEAVTEIVTQIDGYDEAVAAVREETTRG
jgi:hypothetical protein